MKKILYTLSLLVAVSVQAQDKYVPTIKEGSTLHYTGSINGQSFSLIFSLDSIKPDLVKIGWNVDGFGSGSFVMNSKSLESGTRRYSGQPTPGAREEMADDQVVLILSKAQWTSLQKDKKVTFDTKIYTVKTATEQQQIKLAGKTVDAILLESPDGTNHIWILNNPALPVMLKSEGNTVGADLAIDSVE